MEDGAKENTALNIQKPLEILVTDEDKHGTDIACMSDFFGIYIEQLSAELSNQVMRGVVEKNTCSRCTNFRGTCTWC